MNLTKEAEHYLRYLNRHIECVKIAYERLKEIIPNLFDGYDDEIILKTESNIKLHDNIKFSPQRLKIYGEHFVGKSNREEYNNLILEHFRNCPHHYQHWIVVYQPDIIEAVEIPYEYIIEMICDWYSFSFIKNDEYEIVRWYKEARSRMIFAPKTQQIIDNIIKQIEIFIEKSGEKK